MTERMTGGQALARGLCRWGVETMFGLPGVHLDHFFDALHGMQDRLRMIHARHEQGAGYMALGYAMASGRPGVFAVVPGPGVLNTGAALATAYAVNAPVLCLTTTVWRPLIARGHGALHEIPDQAGILRRLTKWCARVDDPAAIPEYVDEAFHQLQSGRPRPVALEIPPEVLGESAAMHWPDPARLPPSPSLDNRAIEAAAKLIAGAKAPVIVVGGGAQHAAGAVRRLAETLQAPVISRQMGRGVLSAREPLAVPAAAAAPLWREADVVIGIGTRLQQLREWGRDEELRVVRIDVDVEEINRLGAPAAAIVGDAAPATEALTTALAQHKVRDKGRAGRVGDVRDAFRKGMATKLAPQVAWLQAIRAALPDDGLFVEDLTQVCYGAKIDFPVYRPRTYICSGYEGTLGAGYAMALGAQAALPQRAVLSVNGDGGFMYNVQELASAALHGLPVVALVFSDGRYGNVHMIQKSWYGGRLMSTALHNPDFVAMAESFGVSAARVREPEELGPVLARAFEARVPALVDIPFDIDDMPWPWDYLIPKRVRGEGA